MNNTKLYTPAFILVCISHILFAGSFNMMVPELPTYITSLGGENYKGLIISLFTLAAGFSRPFSGKLTDTIGRIPVMIIGTLVCVVTGLLYPVLTTIGGFLFLRFLHGFSTGFKPTASTAFAADIVPIHRRGEAMGILGVSMNVGATMFPPLGSYIAMTYSLDIMFYASSGLALISVIILLNLKETLENPEKFTSSHLKIKWNEIIEKRALPIAIVGFFIYFTFGALLTISPDQAEYVGLSNKGYLFSCFTVASVMSRLVAGRVSDIYGRLIVIKVAMLMLIIALILTSQATNVTMLMLSWGGIGFSSGIASPAIFALIIDESPAHLKGRFTATLFIAIEVSIGTAALVSAWLYGNDSSNFPMTYLTFAAITLLGVLYLHFLYNSHLESIKNKIGKSS